MQCRLNLTAVRCIAAFGRRIVSAMQRRDIPRRATNDLLASDEIAVTQPDFTPWRQSEEFFRRVLHEIVLLDVKLPAKGDWPSTRRGIVRMIDCLQGFGLTRRIIFDDQLQRPQHGHPPRRDRIERVANRGVQLGGVDDTVSARLPDAAHQFSYRSRRITAPPHAGESWHTW